MTMKIENYEGSADTFTFQYNPQVFDDTVDKFVDQQDYIYGFSYFGLTAPIKSKRIINITGHFSGATKDTNYRALAKHMADNKLKKLYFSTDKFYIVVPRTVKKTQSGGRTNFVDYVAGFISPFGILFSDTQKSGLYDSAEENEGNIFTPIEKITGSVTNGVAVEISDDDGNGLAFTPTATGTLTIYLVKMDDIGSDNYFTEYFYAVVGGTKQILSVANTNKSMILGLDASQSLATLFTGGTITGITPTFYFRDGFSHE